MEKQQKPKPSNLSKAKLILVAVALISLSTALVVAGYLTGNKSTVNREPQVLTAPTPISSPTKVLESKNNLAANEPEIKLSNIKSSLPANWKMENESDLSVTLVKSDTKISAKMTIEKCDDSSDFSCFGSGRSNYTETVNGGIYDLISADRVIDFGLNLIKDNNGHLYRVSVDFGSHQYTVKEADEIRKMIITVFPSIFVFSKDEIADWQTCRNEKYGFELMHPGDWMLSDITNYQINTNGSLLNIGIGMPSSASIEGYVQVLPDNNYEDAENRYMKNYANNYGQKIVSRKIFSVNDINGEEVVIKDDLMEEYERDRVFLVLRDGKIYAIGLTFTGVYYTKEADAQLDKILSTFKFIEKESFSCGNSTVADIDGNVYNTVKIGDQCWLKENLKVAKNPEGKPITRYCYNNDSKICETDGGLYDWNTAMNSSVVEGNQGICPNGWHVPKDSEWYILENGLKDEGQTCSRLREGDIDDPINVYCATAGTKLQIGGSSGFDAILVGFRNATESFEYRGLSALFWSSTEFNGFKGAISAWERFLNLDVSEVHQFTNDKAAALSVRCLKD